MGPRAAKIPRARLARLDSRRAERLDGVIVTLCVLFGLSSSFSRVGVFDVLNKGIVALLCVAVVGVCATRSQPRWLYALLAVTGLLHAIAFGFPVSPSEGVATYLTFAFWVLFFSYLACNLRHVVKAVRRKESFLRWSLAAWEAVTLVSFFLPMCYETGWGGARYFTSFTTDSFEIAPVAMLMLAVDIVLYRLDGRAGRALALAAVPLACVFAAGTRTYLVVVVLELLLLLRLVVRGRGAYAALAVATVAACAALAGVTNIGAKFESATFDTDDAGVFLEVFTNGRSRFWAVDIEAFLEGTPFEVAFGHGFSYVYDVNQQMVGARLYAHNDFINILLNFGVAGVAVYLAAFVPLARKVGACAGGFVCLLFVLMWLFNAFFNMLYVYVAAVVGMGLIVVALSCPRPQEASRR